MCIMIKEPFGSGRIHDTYILKNDGGIPEYVLQRINTQAFRDPQTLMHNLQKITDFIRSKGGNTLEFLPFAGEGLLHAEDGGLWRKSRYIASDTYDRSNAPEILREAGRAFGEFAALLSDFPGELPETIPDFHNTRKHLKACFDAAKEDAFGRAQETAPLLQILKDAAPEICGIYDKICAVSPRRITHNDTKLNNVLFEKGGKKALCVIDLDTVQPGYLLYDFADGARSAALRWQPGKAAEFSEEKYESFRDGYLQGAGPLLSPAEKELLRPAFLAVCTELGARFLEDYLRGDVYFRHPEEKGTLQRAESLLFFVKEKAETL